MELNDIYDIENFMVYIARHSLQDVKKMTMSELEYKIPKILEIVKAERQAGQIQ